MSERLILHAMHLMFLSLVVLPTYLAAEKGKWPTVILGGMCFLASLVLYNDTLRQVTVRKTREEK